MNRTDAPHPVEALLLVGLAVLWAAWTLARAVLTPLIALLLTIVWRPVPGAAEAAPAVPELMPEPIAAPSPVIHPLAVLAEQLMAHTQRELMEMARTRRRLPKSQLIAQVIACG